MAARWYDIPYTLGMHFFEQQHAARRLTSIFMVQFALVAIIGILILGVTVPLIVGMFSRVWGLALTLPLVRLVTGQPMGEAAWIVLAINTGVASAVFLVAVLIQRFLLSRSHELLTEKIACELVPRSATRRDCKPLLNVVEEMSLAAAIPAPAVYVWNNDAINAMALGANVADAKLVVSRGCLKRLRRDELQGVIAHEFSHILNGDMALNLRIAAYISALKLTLRIGSFLVTFPMNLKGRNKLPAELLSWFFLYVPLGVLLVVLGTPHYVGGRMLQAAICRQRERLADASAVQFTRNPQGLKTALLKAAALDDPSRSGPWQLDDLAHLCFTPAFSRSWFRTHPSYEARLRALDPKFYPGEMGAMCETLAKEEAREAVAAESAPPAKVTPLQRAGQLRDLVWTLAVPDAADAAANDAKPASAAGAGSFERILALLLEADQAAQGAQLAAITQRLGDVRAMRVRAELHGLRQMRRADRILEVERLLPDLREMDRQAKQHAHDLVVALEQLDEYVNVFEYALARTVRNFLHENLQPQLPRDVLTAPEAATSLQVLFSVMAQCGSSAAEQAERAYAAAMGAFNADARRPFVNISRWAKPLDSALAQLDRLQPKSKLRLLGALELVVQHDGRAREEELALLRVVAAALHCPPVRTLSPTQAEALPLEEGAAS